MEKTKEIAGRIQGSLLIEKVRPEKGFFIKSRERYISSKDARENSRFIWEPVTVGDMWVDKIDDRCKLHFIVHRTDGSVNQVDQPISPPRYDLYVGYKLDANRIDLIEKILHENRTGLCIKRHAATKLLHVKVIQILWDELIDNAKNADKTCRNTVSRY